MTTVYVETSVWSQAFAEDAPDLRKATLLFFDRVRAGECEIFISDMVVDELEQSPPELREKFARLIRDVEPAELELSDEAARLAEQFLSLRAVPPGKIVDARHVAIAVVNELDILASWNYRHMVNVRRREVFGHISAMNGYYRPLHIVSPPEVDYGSQQGC